MYDQDDSIRLLKRYADIKSELSKEQGAAIAKYLRERGFINKDDYNIVTDSWCSRRSRVDSLLKMTISRGSEILSCFIDSLKSVCPTIISSLEKTKITDKDREDMRRLKECSSGRMNANVKSCVRGKIADRVITFFQNHLCDSPQVLDDMSDALLSRLTISVGDHTNIINCLLIHEKIFTIFNTLMTYTDLDLESELQAVLEEGIYDEYCLRKPYLEDCCFTDANWFRRYSFPVSTKLTELLRWVVSNESYVHHCMQLTSLRFRQVQGRTWEFMRLPISSEVPFEPRRLQLAMVQIIQRGCRKTGIKLECPLYMSVFILTPGHYCIYDWIKGHDKEDIIHVYLETEEDKSLIIKDDQMCDYECPAMQILREEMDPDQLQQHVYVMSRIDLSDDLTCEHKDPAMKRLKELDLDELQQQLFDRSSHGIVDEKEKDKLQITVAIKGLTRRERMGMLLKRICQLKNWFTLLEKFCKEHDYFLYNKLFHEHQQSLLGKRLTTHRNTDDIWGEKDYEKGGGMQQLFMMRLDVETDESYAETDDLEAKFLP